MSFKEWDQLNVSKAEIDRIGEALKKEEFRKMLVDYCEEISDPENRKLYEKEITQLERERGVDITFINPEPGYVIKTSSDGKTKTFINISTSDKIEKPSSTSTTNPQGQRGLNWRFDLHLNYRLNININVLLLYSLPYSLAPPRRDQDKKGELCHVYDCVFHPDAMHLANKNDAFRKLMNDTAIDGVQNAFKVELDRQNLKFPKMSFKGMAKPTVVRKRSDNPPEDLEPSPIDGIYPPMPSENANKPVTLIPMDDYPTNKYTTPKYKIVQRRDIEYHELTNELDAKLNVLIPKQLVITIDLPLLNCTQDANLDVTDNHIYLCSENPSKYKLKVQLPYTVNEVNGTAKFDKSKRQLVITLPVIKEKKMKITDLLREDSGIESDHVSTNGITNDEQESNSSNDVVPENDSEATGSLDGGDFLEDSIYYVLPSFNFNQVDELMAFTLHVKNVDPSSIEIQRLDADNLAVIKFSSIGAGFYPIWYSFCAKFPAKNPEIFKDISAEAWDNNVIFQFELNDFDFNEYLAGRNADTLVAYDALLKTPMKSSAQDEINNESYNIDVSVESGSEIVLIVTPIEKEAEEVVEMKTEKIKPLRDQMTSNDEVSEDVFDESQLNGSNKQQDPKRIKKSIKKRQNKKIRSMSESFCDELKVINEMDSLKLEKEETNANDQRKKVRSQSESSSDEQMTHQEMMDQVQSKYKSILKNRSVSECNDSSVDDHAHHRFYSYSVSTDFGISQSHDSMSESCKKTVRFNDIIAKKLFR